MKKPLAGFTLIEILIAITIFSVIALSLYSTFFSGTSVWKRSESENRLYQEARWSLDSIAKELSNAIILDYKNMYPDFVVFDGGPDKVSFFNASDDGIKRIAYFLENENSETLLKRQEVPLLDDLSSSIEEIQPETLSFLVTEGGLRFSYAYAGSQEEIEWQNNWSDQENLPKGVKIELVLRSPLNPGIKKTFRKTVFIPLGIIKEQGAQ